jgi:catechol 2,3-dioxygenase-like lactoylglutathione lyase family enzyme
VNAVSTQPLPALGLSHLNLDVADLDASEHFYRDTLGLSVERTPATLVVRANFLLVLAAGPRQVGGSFHFGFQVPDAAAVDAWFGHLRGIGVTIIEQPVARGAVYVGRILDPDAYPIEIYCER